MSEAAPDKPKSGLPIAAHLALLVAIALAAAYVVNLAAVVMLPPRPPDVMRGDKVLDAFVEGYTAARDGRAPAGGGAKWTTTKERPRTGPMPRPGRLLIRDLSKRLNVDPRKVIVAFDPTPSDVVVFRVRTEEFRMQHDRSDVERHRAMMARDEAVQTWLSTEVAAAYDALKAAPSRAVSPSKVRARLAAAHRKIAEKA